MSEIPNGISDILIEFLESWAGQSRTFFLHGSRLHYSSTGAKSLATNTWIQVGIESLTEFMSESRLAPKLAKACATELHDRELYATILTQN
jgi:hypothetical protein